MPGAIKVIIVDDHAVVRAGYRLLLEAAPDIEVIAELGSGEEAYRKYNDLEPDVLVMDISMPGMGGLEAIRRIMARYQNARILVFTMHDSSIFAEHVLQAGARGYVTKNSAPNSLATAVRKIYAGEIYVEEAIAKKLKTGAARKRQTPFSGLSSREFQILCLTAEGASVNEIADRLSLSTKTVSNYLSAIKEKIEVTSTAHLVRLAIQHNISSV